MVQLLATIYQLLTTGSSCTKRELYYLHLELAQTPAYTYDTLEDVCALLDADPWELHVYNTSKGLIAGPIVLTLSDGQRIDCNGRWGTAVPLDVGSVTEIRLAAKLVLVVEKDTVFKRLLEDGILSTFPDTLVLITVEGKVCFKRGLWYDYTCAIAGQRISGCFNATAAEKDFRLDARAHLRTDGCRSAWN